MGQFDKEPEIFSLTQNRSSKVDLKPFQTSNNSMFMKFPRYVNCKDNVRR